jgi:hypothetical protein
LQHLLLIFEVFFGQGPTGEVEKGLYFAVFMTFELKSNSMLGKAGVDPAGIAGVF